MSARNRFAILLVEVDHQYVGAGLREVDGDLAADTPASAGDDGDLVLQRLSLRSHAEIMNAARRRVKRRTLRRLRLQGERAPARSVSSRP